MEHLPPRLTLLPSAAGPSADGAAGSGAAPHHAGGGPASELVYVCAYEAGRLVHEEALTIQDLELIFGPAGKVRAAAVCSATGARAVHVCCWRGECWGSSYVLGLGHKGRGPSGWRGNALQQGAVWLGTYHNQDDSL